MILNDGHAMARNGVYTLSCFRNFNTVLWRIDCSHAVFKINAVTPILALRVNIHHKVWHTLCMLGNIMYCRMDAID